MSGVCAGLFNDEDLDVVFDGHVTDSCTFFFWVGNQAIPDMIGL